MKKKFVYVGLVLLSAAILLYSCSKGYNSSPNTYSPPSPGGGATSTVTIQNMAFTPDTLTVKAGTTVTWYNMDEVPHTVVDLNGRFSSPSIAPGYSYAYPFTVVGTYTYHCTIHPEMKTGVIIVTN